MSFLKLKFPYARREEWWMRWLKPLYAMGKNNQRFSNNLSWNMKILQISLLKKSCWRILMIKISNNRIFALYKMDSMLTFLMSSLLKWIFESMVFGFFTFGFCFLETMFNNVRYYIWVHLLEEKSLITNKWLKTLKPINGSLEIITVIV